ncbi:antichymotrypsin-2-like isoform X3 [Macrosteles quadrilineatus]|uniref:antichymotrypsin-2-like isoform X3 n=1 Tax=Macrosteles quadrilineatus TaxID=74068 RepID=UPI0023E26D78|nr:antichymotrypsin-2-like isoform X3 [Macrosteles quadrilineatus]
MRRLVLVVSVALLLQTTMADPNNLAISQASNAFASQLYQELAKTPGNVLVCPLSAHIALTLVHQGAGGNTGNELGKALHLAGSNDNIKNNYKTLLTGLQDDVLKIATKLYPATSFTPKPDYVIVAKQYFLSDVESLDYSKAAEAAKTINTYVENKTNNKIHDIIKPASLSDLTRLVIINAVHFKATWAKTFPPAFSSNFKVTPTEVIKTDFLSLTDHFPYKEDRALGAKVLKMDYEGGKYSMVFVLPIKEDGLQEVEHKLANTSMDSLLTDLREQRVETTIPKFKIEQEMQLKDTLMKMGINSIFDSRANLSNLAQGENLFVDSVIQKTFIDVNEKGTEAAAATAILIVSESATFYTVPPEVFRADHPFVLYLIKTEPLATAIFCGRFAIPKQMLSD